MQILKMTFNFSCMYGGLGSEDGPPSLFISSFTTSALFIRLHILLKIESFFTFCAFKYVPCLTSCMFLFLILIVLISFPLCFISCIALLSLNLKSLNKHHRHLSTELMTKGYYPSSSLPINHSKKNLSKCKNLLKVPDLL